MTRTRKWMTAAALLLAAALLAIVVYGSRVAALLVAYKAKMTCSGVFVAGRSASDVLASLDRDDLAILRYIDASIHTSPTGASAGIFGVLERRAEFHAGTGCTLLSSDERAASTPVLPMTTSDGGRAAVRDGALADATRQHQALNRALDAAFEETDPSHPKRTLAIVVLQNGGIVAERYADGVGPATPLIGWSMTKSVINALMGVLVGEGRVSVTDRASVPEWQADGDPRRAITIDQLLRMSSGLQFDERPGNPLNDVMQMLLAEPDAAAYAGHQPLDSAPGSTWQYSSGTTNILSGVIRRIMNDDAAYWSLPRRALFEPLGMEHAVLETDAHGTFVGSSFMYATARDWARLGQLYLQDGVWNGERLLPAGWVDYSRTPAPADRGGHYGAHFWLDVPEGYRGEKDDLPGDAFHAAGHEGQFVTIVPSRNIVIVRLGRTRYAGAWNHVRFVHDVLSGS